MKKSNRVIVTVLLIGVVTLSSVLILNKVFGTLRLDLTEHRLYTLSGGTHNIVSNLNQDLNAKLFYSRTAAMKGPEQIRYYNNYFLYVRELLQEYVNLSNGRLSLEVIDPRPFSDGEEEAISYGLQKFNITETETFFFGLAVTSELGKHEVISFFEPDRQEFVEYDISKIISRISTPEKRAIGILSSLPVAGSDMSPYMRQMMQMQGRQPEQPWTIVTQLRDEYEVVPVEPEADEIPDNVDFLVVIHPKNLSDTTLYAIDQFVMAGGKLIVFVDPFSISDQPPFAQQNPQMMMNYDASSEMNKLLETWGVRLEKGKIAADMNMAITAQLSRGVPPSPIPIFMQVDGDNVNADEVVTGKLHDIKLLYAGELSVIEGVEVEITPLITTSDEGGTWEPSNAFELRMPNATAIMQALTPRDNPVMLACRITGKLKSAFPDGPPPAEEDEVDEDELEDEEDIAEEEEATHIAESSEEASVIVVSDVDMISDNLSYQQTFFGVAQVGDNASLLLNSIEFLSGSSDLITIRSRGRFRRPFDVVDRIEAEAEEKTAAKVEETNQRIAQFRERLNQLDEQATDENVKLLENAAMKEREKIQADIRAAERRLRQLNAGKRENIENLGLVLQTINMVLAPAAVLIIAVVIGAVRFSRAKKYTARRTQE